jgi:FKBP-type peptidyl-prolyl cis-trans isomerase (trigger factor)
MKRKGQFMSKINLIIMIILMCSFLFFACSKNYDNVKIIDGTISEEEIPEFIQLGDYKGVIVKMPKIKNVTDRDIQEQIDYALRKAGETALTPENVQVVSEYASIAEYKKETKKNLLKLNKASQENELMNKAWDAALSNAVLKKCPQTMLDKEISEVKAVYINYTQLFGLTYNKVLERFDITEEDIRAKAYNYVKSDIMVYAIARAEGIVVDNNEYKEEVNKRMEYYKAGTEKDLAAVMGNNTDLKFIFLADKVMKFVYENAEIIKSSD